MASLLAVVLAKRGGHAAEAEELYNTTISAQQRIVGFNHPETQETMQHWRMVQYITHYNIAPFFQMEPKILI